MAMPPFVSYLLSAPVLTARIPQFVVYTLFYWFLPLPYMGQLLVVGCLGALATEYGRFLAADGPQDPSITAQEFIDAHVPTTIFYILMLGACGLLIFAFCFPEYMSVVTIFIIAGCTWASYYTGKYVGMKYGLRIF